MKPSGSSRRRQRSPTSNRSTCRDRASRRSMRRGRGAGVPLYSHWGAGKAELDSGRISRWTGAGESPRAGRSGRTCGRGALSDVRPGLSVEDMLVQCGAVWGFGSLAGGLRGARGRWGRRARGRGQAGLQAGWRARSWGALLLALSEAVSAALPRRLQKAPESDSNFCRTLGLSPQPSHVACGREPCSRPLRSPFFRA